MSDQGLSKEFADNLFKQVVKIWLTPEVTRRREAGKLQGELAVWAVQVLFDPSGGESVRINDEVNGEFHVRAGAEEDALITHENLHHFTDQDCRVPSAARRCAKLRTHHSDDASRWVLHLV